MKNTYQLIKSISWAVSPQNEHKQNQIAYKQTKHPGIYSYPDINKHLKEDRLLNIYLVVALIAINLSVGP